MDNNTRSKAESVMTLFCGGDLEVLDSEVPSLSPCFITLALTIVPFTFLAATSSFYIGRLRIPDLKVKKPLVYVLRLLCTVVTLAATAASDVTCLMTEGCGHGSITISFACCFIALMVHLIYLSRLMKVHFLYRRGPMIVNICWVITLPHYIAKGQYYIAKLVQGIPDHGTLSVLEEAAALISCLSQLIYFVCLMVPNGRYRTISIQQEDLGAPEEDGQYMDSGRSSFFNVSQEQTRNRLCPADTANCFSKLLFCWVQPLMKKGSNRQLNSEDSVYFLPENLDTGYLDRIFSNRLQNTLKSSQGNDFKKNLLLRALHRTFGCIYYSSGILKFLADALAFSGPLLLNKLVNFIENSEEPLAHGYYYATGLFLSTLVGSLLSTHFDYQVNKVKIRVKSALIGTIYRKTMHAQPTELSSYTTGQVTNFMSTDVDRVVNFCPSFHEFWSLPFQVAVTLYLLYDQVGIVFLAGVGLAIVMIIFNRYLAKKIGEYNESMMKEKDSRVKLMTEILLGIRVVKFNAWERFLSEKLTRIRKRELKSLQGIKYFDAGCVYLWATTPVLISLLTFSIYSTTGHELTAAKVFTVIALINMLIAPLNAFPWVVNGLMEAWISVDRLNKFVIIRDLDLDQYYHFPSEIKEENLDLAVDITDGSFSWGSQEKPEMSESSSSDDGIDQGLNDICLKIREGQFIGVIGQVGSGKSSLLSALMAEMRKDSGKISIDCLNDGFAVVPQEPWIQNATVRDNIIWGKPYDACRYEAVIDSCALVEDLQILPQHDLTEVGENGVTLSGGQKARIALARAVYQDKSLYLLDDPLAAVDQHVAALLHDRCITGELSQKTRILCTHHTKYLRHADMIIEMENGEIKQTGTPKELLQLSSPPIRKEKCHRKGNNTSRPFPTPVDISESDTNTVTSEASRLMTEEEKAIGTVAFHVYKSYMMAIGSCLSSLIIAFLFLMQGSKVTSDWWLSYWVTSLKTNESSLLHFDYDESFVSNTSGDNIPVSHSLRHIHFVQPLALPVTSYTTFLRTNANTTSHTSHDTKWYLMIYGCLATANSLFTLFRAFLFAYGGIRAAKVLHSLLLKNVLKAPIAFFDVTPVGRILNRFSSDTYAIDDSLPFILNIFLAQFVGVIGTIIITCYGLPWFSLTLIPLGLFYYYIQYYYRLTSRELKRLSSISLSPIYAHFTESLCGLSTIRAFKKQDMFKTKNITLLDSNQRCNFSTIAAQEWFSIRLQLIGVAMVTGVSFIAVIMHEKSSVSPGLAGLALSYALSVTSRLSGVITSFTETEKQMVAVEREDHYINKIPKEREPSKEEVVPFMWPKQGRIEFVDVSLQYREGLPPALNQISFRIGHGEKIGIVGRTGSGKSSLLMLLFGMVDPCNGKVIIDGADIQDLPLHVLRSSLSIIPQDPFLFSGSMEENLVPTMEENGENEAMDKSALWQVLEKCNLAEKVLRMGGLGTSAGERGKRLSVGQRQLLCLARALLTQTKIVCLDEATANVDGVSDRILQETIREQFRDCTVLTIAHRIDTIMDCDRVLVMDNGRIAEFDEPKTLLSDSCSLFSKLARANEATNSTIK